MARRFFRWSDNIYNYVIIIIQHICAASSGYCVSRYMRCNVLSRHTGKLKPGPRCPGPWGSAHRLTAVWKQMSTQHGQKKLPRPETLFAEARGISSRVLRVLNCLQMQSCTTGACLQRPTWSEKITVNSTNQQPWGKCPLRVTSHGWEMWCLLGATSTRT